MSDTTALMTEQFQQLLATHCSPKVVRGIEGGESSNALWQALRDSGFLDALVPEADGGAGLSLTEIYPLLEWCGRHALPLPFGATAIARAMLAAGRIELPNAPIALADANHAGDGTLTALHVPYATTASFALLTTPTALLLMPLNSADRTPLAPHGLSAHLRWSKDAKPSWQLETRADLLTVQASLLAAEMAGAMTAIFDKTLQYANDRVQFGRSIGKFQAIQHQISIMAEQTALAQTAARRGCACGAAMPSARSAAIAKAVVSEAAVKVAALGHAIHGAIGITEEYDLQLFTRRLYEWRLCGGTESFWQRRLGAELLGSDAACILDFIR